MSERKEIRIVPSEHGSWDVHHGDTYADGLTFDEALGLVEALLMPESRPCMTWLKTAEQHQAWRSRIASMAPESQASGEPDTDPDFQIQEPAQ